MGGWGLLIRQDPSTSLVAERYTPILYDETDGLRKLVAQTLGQPTSAVVMSCTCFISPSRLVDDMTAIRANSMRTSV